LFSCPLHVMSNDLHVGGLHMLFVGIKATLQPFPALLCPEVEIEGTFEPG